MHRLCDGPPSHATTTSAGLSPVCRTAVCLGGAPPAQEPARGLPRFTTGTTWGHQDLLDIVEEICERFILIEKGCPMPLPDMITLRREPRFTDDLGGLA